MNTFLRKNKSTLLLLAAFLLGWLIMVVFRTDKTQELFNHPQKGQVYILKSGTEYAPLFLDSLTTNEYFFYDYSYVFKGAVPERNQLTIDEFVTSFYVIYDQQEMNRLNEKGQLVKIFPNID